MTLANAAAELKQACDTIEVQLVNKGLIAEQDLPDFRLRCYNGLPPLLVQRTRLRNPKGDSSWFALAKERRDALWSDYDEYQISWMHYRWEVESQKEEERLRRLYFETGEITSSGPSAQ